MKAFEQAFLDLIPDLISCVLLGTLLHLSVIQFLYIIYICTHMHTSILMSQCYLNDLMHKAT